VRALLASFLLLGASLPARAQPAVTSAAPERVAVTVYRDLNRASARPNLQWLNGYALISETRRVELPAGESELHFEGVAGGILPQSAIVTGFPDGVVERNQDALLLSPGTLLDRSLGQRVSIRRTSKASGQVREEQAVIRSGNDGAVVLQTAAGIEALRCSGLSETPAYDRVPPGLSAKPTLSVRVRSAQPLSATVTLSYLANGFDWQADYVATLSPDEQRLKLTAWLTLANGDETGFANATTQAVAGKLNRRDAQPIRPEARPLSLQCWPADTTSDIPEEQLEPPYPPAPPPPPPPPAPMAERGGEDIVVTGTRVMAERERLGDLQLYRIPIPVTVAARSQKQVALLEQPRVRVTPVYRVRLDADANRDSGAAQLVLTSRNREREGLGLPLPAGGVLVFREGQDRPLLIGEGRIDDLAVGEDVEIRLAEAPGVGWRVELDGGAKGRHALTVTNDRAVPVRLEAELRGDGRITGGARLGRRNGASLWQVTVPANGAATLRYRYREPG